MDYKSLQRIEAPRALTGRPATGRRSGLVEAVRQPARVAGGEGLPVVVEVGEHLDLVPPRRDSPLPLLQLALGVVAATPPVSAVEADVGPVRGRLVRLEGALGVVADHERDSMAAKEVIDLGGEPALVAKLEAVPSSRELLEGGA